MRVPKPHGYIGGAPGSLAQALSRQEQHAEEVSNLSDSWREDSRLARDMSHNGNCIGVTTQRRLLGVLDYGSHGQEHPNP